MTHQIPLGTIFALTVAVSCSPSNTPDTQSTSPSVSAVTANDFALFSWHWHGRHTGGAMSKGGATSAGGVMSAGGVTSSGGTTSTGGGRTGGSMSAGGVTSSGGTASTGGVSIGGVMSAGGSSSTGGVMSAGGSSGIGGVVATGGTGTSGLFQNGFFLIGTFMPTINEFGTWHGRGVNTGVGLNSYTDPSVGRTLQVAMQDWDAKARAQGMRTIRNPMPNPADDVGNTTLLAWDQMDEPQASGAGMRNLASCVANYQQWKAVDPSRPVFLNFAGVDVANAIAGPQPSWCTDATGGCSLASNHVDYINGALDWVANDVYPCAGYLSDESRRCDPSYVGDPIDKIRSWTDKPQFAFIETSNQRFVPQSTRGPTKDEVRAEIWVAIVHGVRGYIFFPQVVPYDGIGATNDGTPADVAAELTTQNATVTQLAPVLQGNINPTTLGAFVPTPLQAGWRDAPGGRYFFVINTKQGTLTNAAITLTGVGTATSASVFNESRTVTLANGKLADTFGAFALHIYVVAK
jgi:hypothetical protein